MSHPIINRVIEIATPIAESLDLEVVGAVFQTNQRPPVLRVDIRNPTDGTSIDDCERMSRALESTLDTTELISGAYVLEISSPGVSRQLSTDREFVSFRGFDVLVYTSEPYQGHQEWTGKLIRRDEESVYINQKGRAIAIPRHLVVQVKLSD
ncbi:ribosome maturation factor RimP [Geitlerinema sp. PCC 9228]|jgi:ribosome maturation factor RimP|uniref:ribosome maturation factor RimP n=1 Tax=Geitlerinema sp. PCC 9228 TaxID=111611 RepID=UPI0008F985DA|nr:ribosome maturation factor RimP [Geitlerinema sp. PCC 9228]